MQPRLQVLGWVGWAGWLAACEQCMHIHPLVPFQPCPLPSTCCSKPGYYADSDRAGTCSLCPAGKQCPLSATATPQNCGKGYFSSAEGSKVCSPCPVNTSQPQAGQKGCVKW